MTSQTISDRDALGQTAARIVAEHGSMERIDDVTTDDLGYDAGLWTRFVDLGIPALLVPEEDGGLGQTLAEVATIAAELGRATVPGPFLSSAVTATAALAALAASPQRSALLESLTEGGQIAAWIDSPAVALSHGDDGGLLLKGEAPSVLGADAADVLVVHAGGYVLEVPAAVTERTTTRLSDQTRRVAAVRFDGVSVPAEAVLGDGASADTASRAARLASALALAADAVGGAEQALALTTEYTKSREQFGRTIGSFQAIKHRLADMFVQVQSAKAITAEAAEGWSRRALSDPDPDLEILTVAAATFATSAYVTVAGEAIQLHGGIGFTWEHPCHRFFKRAWLDRALWGGHTASRASFSDLVIARARAGADAP
ncbi:acyl-CoA dehydrogenase family protein [Pseudonocardia halophobica]|uniref:Acyl-CoA dehydrogenase n=1 Tax=Pseudonocardia halophobica TaxID=29401 RepID=A0A9W6L096_9PSEU|nr:acyl-CoA dehydrogenase family protein [Pseudonocardia halophobica]GLL10567.1 acyl-CoA dehydrogenase [Pseudonocardia halophobica]